MYKDELCSDETADTALKMDDKKNPKSMLRFAVAKEEVLVLPVVL